MKRKTKKFIPPPNPRPPQPRGSSRVNNNKISKWVIMGSLLLIILSGFLVYANSLGGQFLWDDEILIQDNREIQSWGNLPRLFIENIGTGAGRNYNFYRPLHMLTIMANYSVCKFNPAGYHLTNIFFHILTALCIYILANLLFSNNTLSLLTALFFVVHPIHTEVVSYISGRFDSLSAFFMLLALILYLKNNRSVILTYLLVPACLILAILSKENALILPALILLYHYIFGGFRWNKFLPLIAVTAVYIVLRLTILYFPNPSDQIPTTLLERIPGFFVAMTNYATILGLPFGLHMEHGDMLFQISDPKALLGILIIALSAVWAYRCKNNNKLVTFGILWFFICLFPESNLYRINAYMNEHWLYLPSFGFFLILAKYLSILFENGKLKALGLIACIGLLSFYSFLTIKQNDYWKDPVSFYERTLKYAPFSSRLYNNLARQYNMKGRWQEAIGLFKKAIKISPNYAEAYNNLGVVLTDHGMNNDAINAYQMALKIDPSMVGVYSNLGNAYNKARRQKEAVAVFEKALKIKPEASAYNNLAMVYRDLKESGKAVEALKKAQDLDPGNIIISFNLGNAYAAAGDPQGAIAAYKRVIELDSNNAFAYNNIGFLLKSAKEYDEAIEQFNTALKINPGLLEANENLILTYNQTGKFPEARQAARQARQADPSHAEIYNNL